MTSSVDVPEIQLSRPRNTQDRPVDRHLLFQPLVKPPDGALEFPFSLEPRLPVVAQLAATVFRIRSIRLAVGGWVLSRLVSHEPAPECSGWAGAVPSMVLRACSRLWP